VAWVLGGRDTATFKRLYDKLIPIFNLICTMLNDDMPKRKALEGNIDEIRNALKVIGDKDEYRRIQCVYLAICGDCRK
jgi:hypothetical protein